MLDTILKIIIGLLVFTPCAFALALYKIPFFSNSHSGRRHILSLIILLILLAALQMGAVVGLRFATESLMPAANQGKIQSLSLVFGVAGLLILPLLAFSALKK